jgi:hypothetical protein
MGFKISFSLTMSKLELIQGRQSRYKHNIEVLSRNHCRHGKAISITYSDCVFVALVVKYAMQMCRIIVSSVTCLALSYSFSHYLLKGKIVLILSTNFVSNISHSKKN